MENPLSNENPKERYLRRHPIHGQGWIDENDYRNVNNYPYPHIRAKNTPRRIWPENASDWGLQLWVPSQTDMTPRARNTTTGRPPRPHPVLVSDEQYEWEEMDNSDVYAAFYYTIPNFPKCSLRRSCRFTQWEIDENTEEIIMDDCWGCRRMGDDCSMRGYRVARKAIHGDPIIDGREKKLPHYGHIEKPPGWVPPRVPPGGGHGGGGHGGGGGFGGGGGGGDGGDGDGGSGRGDGRGGGFRGDHGSGSRNGFEGSQLGSTPRKPRTDHKSGHRPFYKTYPRNEGHRSNARAGPSRSRFTPETPLRGRGQRSSPIEEDDEIDDDRRRFMTPGLERLQDLFREDSVDSMDVDLNLGTFDNGRRDNIMNINQPETPGEPSQNGREVSTTPLFPGIGQVAGASSKEKEKGTTLPKLGEPSTQKDAEKEVPAVKEEVDEKPAMIEPAGDASGNDEEEGIEYIKTSFAGEGTGKGTVEEPFVIFGYDVVE